jgi:hypothetical protein
MILLTKKNLEIITQTVLENMEDNNGRGEFDKEVGIEQAISKVCEWFENDNEAKKQLEK